LDKVELSQSIADQIEEVVKEKASPELRDLIRKVEYLMEQNKTIARGLVMLHESSETAPAGMPSGELQVPVPMGIPKQSQGYQKSISS